MVDSKADGSVVDCQVAVVEYCVLVVAVQDSDKTEQDCPREV